MAPDRGDSLTRAESDMEVDLGDSALTVRNSRLNPHAEETPSTIMEPIRRTPEDVSIEVSELDISSTSALPDHRSSDSLSSVPAHLSHDPANNQKRTDPFQFGQRYLTASDDVFAYNAWDHVTPDSAYSVYAESQYEFQRSNPVSEYDGSRINSTPEKWWDTFYRHKSSTFFKDRKWLVQEFPVLREMTRKDAGKKRILEIGAGAGNTAFPILRMNDNPELEMFAYDFSKIAVQTMRRDDEYVKRHGFREGREAGFGHVRCEVWDLASCSADPSDNLPTGIDFNSIDVVILIFTFSALAPSQWKQAVKNIWHVLKPGGLLLFRDYGRGDLAQVRFKSGRWMEENFYVRGDGTRVYFFEKEEIRNIFTGKIAGYQRESAEGVTAQEEETSPLNGSIGEEQQSFPGATMNDPVRFDDKQMPRFEVLDLDIDRRLIVNRQRRIKMYRCWLQGRFQKSVPELVTG